jgi:hypothetical protein
LTKFKAVKILDKKHCCRLAVPGCLSRIPDPDFYPSRIPDLVSKNNNKREGRKKFVILFYVVTIKIHKIKSYFIFEIPKKKNLGRIQVSKSTGSRIRNTGYRKQTDWVGGEEMLPVEVFPPAVCFGAALVGAVENLPVATVRGGAVRRPVLVVVGAGALLMQRVPGVVQLVQAGSAATRLTAVGVRPRGLRAANLLHAKKNTFRNSVHIYTINSVPNPNPDPPNPHAFRPPGSGSISQRYGSGFFYQQGNIVRKTLIPTVLRLLLDVLS